MGTASVAFGTPRAPRQTPVLQPISFAAWCGTVLALVAVAVGIVFLFVVFACGGGLNGL
jgi:hypothetical protein